MNAIYTVMLADGTTGKIDSDSINGQSAEDFIGEIMRITSHDENGNIFEIEGTLIEVF